MSLSFILDFCIWLVKQVVTVNKAELTAEKEIANGVSSEERVPRLIYLRRSRW